MLNKLAKEIANWRVSRGFHTPYTISPDVFVPNITSGNVMLGRLMLVVTEISEAAEAVRSNDTENFKEELADTFIRLLDICGTMGIDIENEIAKKMGHNRNRPVKHGRQTTL